MADGVMSLVELCKPQRPNILIVNSSEPRRMQECVET